MSAVSTSHPVATAVGARVLADGGNAVDAAVAATWALAVCEPSGSGVGGQAYLVVAGPDGTVHSVDGDGRAPASAARRTISPPQQRQGVRATTVPTMPAVLGRAHARWGRLPWADVLAPAVALAQNGFGVTHGESVRLGRVVRAVRRDPATAGLYLVDGRSPRPGARLRLPGLAKTLERLAADGSDDLYAGRCAALLLADQVARGGLVTTGDLLATLEAVRERPALVVRREGLDVATLATGGGVTLLLALAILDRLRPGDDPGERRLAVARATRAAHDVRDRYAADGDPRDVLDAAVVEEAAAVLAAQPPPWLDAGPVRVREEPGDTTHVTVADADGTVVALTSSVQSLYGAKIVCAPLGFVYNNYLRTCTRRPGPYGLGPRCRPRSNAAPTVVLDAAGPVLGLGSAGSRRITSSLLHVLTGVLDGGLGIEAAVAAPRAHLVASGHLWVETGSGSPAPAGPRVVPMTAPHAAMGAVNAVRRTPSGWAAAADPRRDGVAVAQPAAAPARAGARP